MVPYPIRAAIPNIVVRDCFLRRLQRRGRMKLTKKTKRYISILNGLLMMTQTVTVFGWNSMSHRLQGFYNQKVARSLSRSARCHKELLGSVSSDNSVESVSDLRKNLIEKKLEDLGINAVSLHHAAQQSLTDPTSGYDGNFGRSAIRTYRSFLYPKKATNLPNDEQQLAAMAFRTAQQIDFLLKRHESHKEQWVRHHDSPDGTSERRVFPMILLLDNLRSAFNVGSIFRTADATGCAQVITTGITPHPNGNGAEKVSKSALGAEIVVPSRHFPTTREAIEFIREKYPEYQVVGLETTEKSVCYTKFSFPPEGVVLVLGNEVTGVDTKIMPLMDNLLEIPMFGTKNSLNVASCAPIVLYEIVRQWNT